MAQKRRIHVQLVQQGLRVQRGPTTIGGDADLACGTGQGAKQQGQSQRKQGERDDHLDQGEPAVRGRAVRRLR